MMMLRLSRQTVRRTWPAYGGAFVALTFGIVLLGVTVALIGAVTVTTDAPGVTREERLQLDDLSSMFGIMSGVSLFMALFVVGSTFGFVVATRRRELGLLRLVGATPRQVRRLILLEPGVVALLAMVVGSALTTALTPAALWGIRTYGLTDLPLEAPAVWLPWAIAAPAGAIVALLGGWRASKRASRVPPVAALRESSIERRRPSVVQIVVGVLCLGAVGTVAALAGQMAPLFAMIVAVFLPEVMLIGVMCVGTALLPALASLLAHPFARLDVTARFARDQLTAAARTTAALAAPVIAISAVAGSLILTLSFVADWTTAQDRARLTAPLVVQVVDPSVVSSVVEDPSVATADVRRRVSARVTPTDPEVDAIDLEVDVVDLDAAAAGRGLRAVKGDLADLHGNAIAVSQTGTIDYGSDIGATVAVRIDGRELDLTIVAVVPDAPGLYGEMLVPADLVDEGAAMPDAVFLVPRVGVAVPDAEASLASTVGDAGTVLTADDWLDATDAASREANNVGLWVLIGPAGLYAAIAMVNATLIGASQRRRQDAVVRLLGATPRQVRRTAVWEAVLIGGTGLFVGALITLFCGWIVRFAVTQDIDGAALTIPWMPMLGIGVTCIFLVVTAAVAGARVHTVAGRRTAQPDAA
jgi:putative ABC transport system permease protein